MLGKIEKAILSANIGVTPANDGTLIRLVFPENNRVVIYRLPVSDALHLPFISNTVLHLV